jgi:hypothetical protein|tara:strand:+ start:454 stop:699 length:246 start_codon:yes stop_codon:yes gene_type:complete
MLLADGFEKAFIGIAHRACQEDVVAYDYDKCIAILCERDGMEYDEAVEFFWFNTLGAWVGDKTPIFIKPMADIEELYDEEI